MLCSRMKIKKMTAWFGALEGQTIVLGGGLNILSAPNESGKSTWCAFLRAMLYGIDTGQRPRQGQQPDKVKYQPWSGHQMSGSMDLETGFGPITLRRWTERPHQPMQAFSATVTGTDLPVELSPSEAGQILTGVSREVFDRSAFVHQSDLAIRSSPDLEKKMASIVSAGDEDQSYPETEKRLQTWLRHRSERGAAGQEAEKLNQLQEELLQLEEASAELGRLEQSLAEAKTRQETLVQAMEQARSKARKQALKDLNQSRSLVAKAEENVAFARNREEETAQALKETPFGFSGPERARKQAKEDLKKAREFRREAEKLPGIWPAVLAMILGGLLVLLNLKFSWTPLPVAILLYGALAAGLVLWRVHIARRREQLFAGRDAVLRQYDIHSSSQMRELLGEYDSLWEEHTQAEETLSRAEQVLLEAREKQKQAEEPILQGLDFVHGDSDAAKISQAAAQIQREIEQLKEKRAVAEGRVKTMEDPLTLRTEIAGSQSRLESLQAQEKALELALQTMAEADSTLREKFSPLVAQKAASIFAALTEGRYDEVTLDRDLSAKARRTGAAVGYDTDYLSAGTRDQLYLSIRLAVCAMALPEEPSCPLILDDALAAFDQKRMERTLDLLKKVAEKRQVLLFSCHSREKDYFAVDPDVAMVEVGHV